MESTLSTVDPMTGLAPSQGRISVEEVLIERFGVTQLCVGTDHPCTIEETEPVTAVEKLGLSAADQALVLSDNAKRFLGESA